MTALCGDRIFAANPQSFDFNKRAGTPLPPMPRVPVYVGWLVMVGSMPHGLILCLSARSPRQLIRASVLWRGRCMASGSLAKQW